MRRQRVVILAGLIAAASAGCNSLTGPGDADLFIEVLEMRVGGASEPAFVVDFRVENRGKDIAYITPRCGDTLTPLIYERQGENWVSVGGGFCTTNMAMHPWPLQTDESFSGSTGWGDPGTYQLRIKAADREGEESVWVSSEVFRLE